LVVELSAWTAGWLRGCVRRWSGWWSICLLGWLAGRQAVCLSSLAGWSSWLLGRFGGGRAVSLAGREADGWWSR